MRLIAVSDLHLKFNKKKEDSEREKKILDFLSSLVGNLDILVLNGDIFDLWYSWNKVIIKDYFNVYVKLRELQESGCRILFISGNHDFWFNKFLEEEMKFEIFENDCKIDVNGLNCFFSHGDLYTSNDWRYRLFRIIIRFGLLRRVFHAIHPDFALFLGNKISRSSRDRKTKKKIQKNKEQGLINKAESLLKEKFDLVCMGHTHKKKKIKIENGFYVNTGSWLDDSSYLEINEQKIELKTFKMEK